MLSGESDDEWTGAARVIANELTRDLITGQTVEPDPARRGDPRRVESGTSRLRGDAPWSLPIID